MNAPQLVSESITVAGADELELTVRLRHANPAALQQLHDAIKSAAADGKFTLEEDTSVVLALLSVISPDVALRLGYVATILRMALADGRITAPEGLAIAGAITAAAAQ